MNPQNTNSREDYFVQDIDDIEILESEDEEKE